MLLLCVVALASGYGEPYLYQAESNGRSLTRVGVVGINIHGLTYAEGYPDGCGGVA